MDKTLTFSSVEEECCYWQEQARKYYQEYLDVQQELDDFTDGSRQLEAELEASLEQREKTIRDLKHSLNQLQLDNESIRKRLSNYESDYSKMEQKCNALSEEKERLKSYTRELEQVNDDLERAHRVVTESVAGFETMLNQAYEKNALLEMEVDEKEVLQVKLQRLVDETRDLKQELNIKKIQTDCKPNSEKTNLSNDEINQVETETQTIGNEASQNNVTHPIKHTENVLNGNAMTASSRLSALNLVAELLRKVNLEKLLCSKCDKLRCICPNEVHQLVHTQSALPSATFENTSLSTIPPPPPTLFKRFSQKLSAVTSPSTMPLPSNVNISSSCSSSSNSISADNNQQADRSNSLFTSSPLFRTTTPQRYPDKKPSVNGGSDSLRIDY